MGKSTVEETALEGKKRLPHSRGSGVVRSCSWEGTCGAQSNCLQPMPTTTGARTPLAKHRYSDTSQRVAFILEVRRLKAGSRRRNYAWDHKV